MSMLKLVPFHLESKQLQGSHTVITQTYLVACVTTKTVQQQEMEKLHNVVPTQHKSIGELEGQGSLLLLTEHSHLLSAL